MGAEFSSCCGGATDADSQILINDGSPCTGTTPSKSNGKGLPQQSNISSAGNNFSNLYGSEPSTMTTPATLDLSKKEIFRRRFEEGVDVNLILQDKTRLTCQVKLDPSKSFILLSCDSKVRAIGMGDITALLHTPEQLRRVEASAGITDASTCAAIHLAASGNCIPLFFTDPIDKQWFALLMEEARMLAGQQQQPHKK